MVSTCVSSPKMSGDPLGINFNIMKQISSPPTSPQQLENGKDSLQSNSPGLDLSISMDCSEVTVASAVSSEKARIRQQSAMLDKWLMANGGNLYPCREEKEKLAVQMKMTYIQVNRWFANRRRKQTKRINKVVNSPASVTPLPIPASVTQEVVSRVPSPVNKENLLTQITPDMISAFAHALAAQPGKSEEKRDMVVQKQRESAITPPAIDDQMHNVYHPQVVPDLRNSLVSPFQPHEAAAKLLAASAAGTLPTTGLPPTAQTQFNPILLAMFQPLAAQQLQSILQVQALQQQLMQHQLQQALAQAQQQQIEQQQNAQTLWASGSISASPAHASDSEVSELSELSPLPSSDGVRPHSPPFKDPHQLADKSLLRLLNLNQLSEKEQMAVAVLAGFASMGR